MSTANKLQAILNSKEAIKNAISAKGVSITDDDTLDSYADKISQITTGGGTGINYFTTDFNPGYINFYSPTGEIVKYTKSTTDVPEDIPEGFQIANMTKTEGFPLNIPIVPTSYTTTTYGYDINGERTNDKEKVIVAVENSMISDCPNARVAICFGPASTATITNCPNLEMLVVGGISSISCDIALKTLVIMNGTVDLTGVVTKQLTVPAGVTVTNVSNDNMLEYYSTVDSGSIPTGYSNLKYYWIPNTATTINSMAFMGCTSLYYVVIPSTVTNIAANAFMGCVNLKNIEMQSATPPTIAAGAFPTNAGLKITVPAGSLSAYQSAPNWSSYTLEERA